jgi:hypothetical protein
LPKIQNEDGFDELKTLQGFKESRARKHIKVLATDIGHRKRSFLLFLFIVFFFFNLLSK